MNAYFVSLPTRTIYESMGELGEAPVGEWIPQGLFICDTPGQAKAILMTDESVYSDEWINIRCRLIAKNVRLPFGLVECRREFVSESAWKKHIKHCLPCSLWARCPEEDRT